MSLPSNVKSHTYIVFMTDCLIMRYISMLIESLKYILDSKAHCCSSSAINVQKTTKYSNLLLHSNYALHTNCLNFTQVVVLEKDCFLLKFLLFKA